MRKLNSEQTHRAALYLINLLDENKYLVSLKLGSREIEDYIAVCEETAKLLKEKYIK